jgi:phosphopantothenoylcysteine decarboxylase/phosphopantothenate--cysteine ligase
MEEFNSTCHNGLFFMFSGMTINKHILLGVSGGIAAYKSAELVRLLRKQGAEVRVVMTQSAMQFISPLTFQALSGNPVHSELLDADAENAMGHISLARWADLLLIAPATANLIAKLSHGLADDLLSTLYLAATCPVYVAPAMNQAMWNKAVTQENIEKLQRHGVRVIGPEQGDQACGETGFGRMSEPVDICKYLAHALELHSAVLTGRESVNQRRSHPRTFRPRALHHESQFRKNGFRAGECSPKSRRRGDAGQRSSDSGSACKY